MPHRIAVPSADFIRNIGRWQNEALQNPVVITHHGRDRLVLAAPDQFRQDVANESGDAPEEARAAHIALLSNMDEGCLTFSPDGLIESANAAATEFLGRSESELRGRTLKSACSEFLSLIVTDRVQRVWRTRSSERFDADAGDGRFLCFRIYPSNRGVTVLFHNTTEATHLRREREESMSFENAARRHGGVAVLKLDARGRLDSVDQTFCEWTGFNAGDLQGHRLAELVTGAERRDFSAFFETVVRGAAADEINLDFLGRTGAAVPSVVTLAPIVADFVSRGVVAICLKRPQVSPAL